MIRNRHILEAFERALQRNSPPDPKQNREIFDWMYEHARTLGAFPRGDKLEGLKFKTDFVGRLNVRKSPGGVGPGA